MEADIFLHFLIFCKLSAGRKAIPALKKKGWKWSHFHHSSRPLLFLPFTLSDAQAKYGSENRLACILGGRSLRHQADLIYGSAAADGEDGAVRYLTSHVYSFVRIQIQNQKEKERKDDELELKEEEKLDGEGWREKKGKETVMGTLKFLAKHEEGEDEKDFFDDIGGKDNWFTFAEVALES
jgi:hypothetical protein